MKFEREDYPTKESYAKVFNYLVDHKLMHSIRIKGNPQSIISWKVMEEIGMKKEGFFKKRFFLKNDEEGNLSIQMK